MIQDPWAAIWMQSTYSRGGMRRNRCSFVKVGPTESHNPFGNEVNAQFLATILPIHSAGFHGGPSTPRPGGTCISHLELSPWTRHKDICWWMLHITLCSVSKLRTSMDTLQIIKNTRAWTNGCLRWSQKDDKHKNSCVDIIMLKCLTLGCFECP